MIEVDEEGLYYDFTDDFDNIRAAREGWRATFRLLFKRWRDRLGR